MPRRDDFIKVFDQYKAASTTDEFKARMRAQATDNSTKLEDLSEMIQIELAEQAGIDGRAFVEALPLLLTQYDVDQKLCEAFIAFVERESLACDEAELTPAAYTDRLRQIELEREARRGAERAGSPSTYSPSGLENAARVGTSGGMPPQHRIQMMYKQFSLLKLGEKREAEMLDQYSSQMRAQMQGLFSQNPRAKEQFKAQLQMQGVDEPDMDEPERLIHYAIKNMKDIQCEARKDNEAQAKKLGITPDDLISRRLAELEKEMKATSGAGDVTVGSQPGTDGGSGPSGQRYTAGKLRFPIGTAVECNMGPKGWVSGQVKAQA